jgi:hypothetical protein
MDEQDPAGLEPTPSPAAPEAEPAVPAGSAPRRVRMAAIEDAGTLPEGCLFVDEYGSFIGKHRERLRILVKGELVAERPLLGLEHVLVLAGGVTLSADAIRECAQRGVPISLVSRSGKPYAKLLRPS